MPRMNLYLLTTLLCGALGAGACSVEIGGLQGSQTTDPSTSRGGGPGGAVFGRGGGAAPDTLACEPSAAPSVFNNALCLCGDYQGAGNLRIQPAVDSNSKQPTFGVNGRFSQLGNGHVHGTLIAHKGIDGANLRVDGSMRSSSTVGVVNLDVGGDLFVGTDLTSFGVIVGGGVWVGGKVMTIFKAKPVTKLEGTLAPPCACGSDGLDVAAEVAAARASNDNPSAGLAARPELFAKPRLVLNSGRYYFASAAGLGNAQILANGAVRIYVDGDMQFVGNER
ncbi:MAG: hypothetical protein KC503_28575, partial [Myxococcales bacterium]|nr:hypothetical protein [Myxococcales bacterium]